MINGKFFTKWHETLFKLKDPTELSSDSVFGYRTGALRWNNSGHTKYLQVDFDDAIFDYTKALQLDPSLAVAYYNRGTVHYRLGDFQPAVKDLLEAVRLEPENKEFQEGLQECQRMLSLTENKT